MGTKIIIETLNTLRPKPETNRALIILKDAVRGGEYGSDKEFYINNVELLEEYFPKAKNKASENAMYELAQIEYLLNNNIGVVVLHYDSEDFEDDLALILEENENHYDFSVITAPKLEDVKLGLIATAVGSTTVEFHMNVDLDNEGDADTVVEGNRNVSFFNGEGVLGVSSNYKYNDIEDVLIPASVAAQARKLQNRQNDEPYLPVAGETYGVFREFKDLKERLSRKEKEAFQKAYVNPFYLKRGVGVHLVAQNTRNNTSEEGKLEPLNRGHVNTLTNYLADYFRSLGDSYHGLPNNRKTWDHFRLDADKILRKFVRNDGIEDFAVVTGRRLMSEVDIAAGTFKAQIHFLPVRVIESVVLNLIVHDNVETIVEVQVAEEDEE